MQRANERNEKRDSGGKIKLSRSGVVRQARVRVVRWSAEAGVLEERNGGGGESKKGDIMKTPPGDEEKKGTSKWWQNTSMLLPMTISRKIEALKAERYLVSLRQSGRQE